MPLHAPLTTAHGRHPKAPTGDLMQTTGCIATDLANISPADWGTFGWSRSFQQLIGTSLQCCNPPSPGRQRNHPACPCRRHWRLCSLQLPPGSHTARWSRACSISAAAQGAAHQQRQRPPGPPPGPAAAALVTPELIRSKWKSFRTRPALKEAGPGICPGACTGLGPPAGTNASQNSATFQINCPESDCPAGANSMYAAVLY